MPLRPPVAAVVLLDKSAIGEENMLPHLASFLMLKFELSALNQAGALRWMICPDILNLDRPDIM